MALALIAESAVSVVIEKLISAALSYIGTCGAGSSAMQEEIERLKQAFPQIQAILAVVERGQTVGTKQNEGLDAWLWQLRDAVDQAEDVLDEMEYCELEKAVQAGDNEVQQGTALDSKKKANNILGNDTLKRWREGLLTGWRDAWKTSDNVAASRETLLQQRLREAVKALDNAAASSGTLLQIVSQLYNLDAQRQQEDKIRNARETSSFPTKGTIWGRKTEEARIVEWLTKPTSDELENASATVGKVLAFAIVGMGGMGKTALARFFYNNEEVRQCFDLVLWVCVSDQFDVAVLTRKILEAAKVRDSLADKSLNTIQNILKEKLVSKKFLLVLDDVWADNNADQWENLVAPLEFGRRGSKILLTTRMNSVADTVASVLQCEKESLKLSGLKEVDFMHLFNKHAFAGVNIDDHRNLKLIGEQIAKKLGGCPLAAKVLGGCLNSCMDEKYWERSLNENFLNLRESEDSIKMILRLSYHHLPTSLQICFRYCSIFPKDYEFEKNELIRMWIGSGLIKKPIHEKRSLEDIGEEYLNHLARKSLFDIKMHKVLFGHKQCYVGHKQCYVMHDLLHDLAQLVSSGECLGIEGDGFGDIPTTIRHIYVSRINPPMISGLKNLRTLIIHLDKDYDVIVFSEVLKELKSLRLLRVTSDDCKIPDEVGNLIHLRYLSLSPTSWMVIGNERSILPQSACRLHHLEVLKIQNKTKIDDSTLAGMSNLVKLRLLDIPYDKMGRIPWIGKLTSLQQLDNFHVREECGYKIDQLKNLQNLRSLRIRGLENVRSSKEATDANLIEKKNLDKLLLCWSENRSGGLEVDEPLLDKLRPHTNLKELEIGGYAGVRSPYWMTVTSLSNITGIKLSNCERWEDLLPLGQLPLLKFLFLDHMPAVKKFWCSRSVGGCAFPSLQRLGLDEMRDLESLEGDHMFPLLNKLEITSCPSLKSLPALPLTLNQLKIQKVGLTSLPMMQQDSSGGEGRASCPSSHPALSQLRIWECPNLTSLDGFMLQQQYFPALASLTIEYCKNLRHSPEKFFQKLPSLKDMTIEMCPNLILMENRLPETLKRLTLVSSGDLGLSLLESLPLLASLKYLNIDGCASMTSLPPAEVFPRLSQLYIWNCKELSSLDGLQALPSLKYLCIRGCDKLIELSLLQPPIGLTSTSHTDSTGLHILALDQQALLRLEPLRNLSSVSSLTIGDGTELTSLDEQWLLQNRNSLQHLEIWKASSLESLPTSMINLQALCDLRIYDAPLLRTIPELPTSMESLEISGCRPELKEYIEGSGKFANIPYVNVTEKSS